MGQTWILSWNFLSNLGCTIFSFSGMQTIFSLPLKCAGISLFRHWMYRQFYSTLVCIDNSLFYPGIHAQFSDAQFSDAQFSDAQFPATLECTMWSSIYIVCHDTWWSQTECVQHKTLMKASKTRGSHHTLSRHQFTGCDQADILWSDIFIVCKTPAVQFGIWRNYSGLW